MALGATAAQAMRAVAVAGVALGAAGVIIGTVMAFWAVRVMQTQLWDVQPADPLTFGWVIAAMLSVAIAGTVLPARRVLQLAPADTLRAE